MISQPIISLWLIQKRNQTNSAIVKGNCRSKTQSSNPALAAASCCVSVLLAVQHFTVRTAEIRTHSAIALTYKERYPRRTRRNTKERVLLNFVSFVDALYS